MQFDFVRSPSAFLRETLGPIACDSALQEYEFWWEREGRAISDAVDRSGTPWVRMFDAAGRRVDEILYPPEYRSMLLQGYRSGVIWRAFRDDSLLPSFFFLYLSSFYDCGITCPYSVSLSTALPLSKYAEPAIRDRFLPKLLRQGDDVWQGATWMTEIKGGSDLGAGVETVAVPEGPQGGGW